MGTCVKVIAEVIHPRGRNTFYMDFLSNALQHIRMVTSRFLLTYNFTFVAKVKIKVNCINLGMTSP